MPPTAFRGPGRVAIVGHRAEEGARHTDRVLVTARLVKTARLTIVVLASEALAFYSRRPPKAIPIHEASSCYASNTNSHRDPGCAPPQGRARWRWAKGENKALPQRTNESQERAQRGAHR